MHGPPSTSHSAPLSFAPPSASIIIPAHNEASVITRCLTALLRDTHEGEFAVIVVCNGCTDNTAALAEQVAQQFSQQVGQQAYDAQVQVVSTNAASKVVALNTGDAVAGDIFPRIYLDADVVLTTDAARRIIQFLQNATSPHACAPTPLFSLTDRSWCIRAFYHTWLRSNFLQDAPIGNGVYALNASGRARFAEFPDKTADDFFVQLLFPQSERTTLDNAEFVIFPPRSLWGLIKIRTRVYAGNMQLHAMTTEETSTSHKSTFDLLRGVRSTKMLAETLTYVAINGVAKLRALADPHSKRWERDDSSRTNEVRSSS